MDRGLLTEDEKASLAKIEKLAEEIYALAAPLDKYPRHRLSNAAQYIRWIAYAYQNPNDQEALEAISKLGPALAEPLPV